MAAGDKPVVEKVEAAAQKAEAAVEKPIQKLADEDGTHTARPRADCVQTGR